MKKYLIGVDGGGTKTLIVVSDIFGNVINIDKGESTNQNNHTVDYVFDVINNLVKNNLPKDADTYDIGLGISGLIASGKKDELYDRLKTLDKVNNVYLNTDAYVALDSCYYHKDGAIGIIGTGFAIFYRKNNVVTQIGGKGYLIDNSLSGYDIGKRVFLSLHNIEKPNFYNDVMKDYGSLNNIDEEYKKYGEVYLSKFCKYALIYQDDISTSILKECVANFEKYLNQIQGVNNITLLGGLSKIFDKFDIFLSKDIKEKFNINVIKYESVIGTFTYFDEYNDDFLNNLLKNKSLLVD